MRIALFLESLNVQQSGGFQQSLSTTLSLTRKDATKHDFVVFVSSVDTQRFLLKEGIESIRFREGIFRLLDRLSATVVGGAVLRRLRRVGFRRLGRHLDALLDDYKIDLVLFNEISDSVLRIGDHPFITTVWDLNHRDYPEFPEAYCDRAFQRRERQVADSLIRAIAVVSNAPALTRQVSGIYGVDVSRIVELPFIPSISVRRHAAGQKLFSVEDARRKYDLPSQYLFYPAYFTPLKNHLYILEGLCELERQHGITLNTVFCGNGEPSHRVLVERQVQTLGLTSRVRFIGSVPDEEIPALYEGALALVMPTYAGPTNLPPLEAVTLGCPVIYSDFPAFREQMGDAALYCDLADVSSLASHLVALVREPALLEKLRDAGRRTAADIARIDYGARLSPLLDNHAYIRRRWGYPDG